MKIAIDFREGAKEKRAGKGEYVWQLVNAWISANLDDELILVIERGQQIAMPVGKWKAVVIPARGLWWHFLVVLWLEFCRPAKLYFSTTSLIVPSLVRSVKTITTIFDFTVWRFPTTHLPKAVMLEKLFMAPSLRYSNHLIAISEFTKQEAIAIFHVPVNKITVTPLSAGSQFQPMSVSPKAITQLQQRYNLPAKFILYLGTLEPRKNIERLIEAYQRIAHRIPDTKLVLAGARGWHTGDKTYSDTVITGYIEDGDRPLIYNLATGFVFPSLYEGFGLPPLEAMACGTPVITSVSASLPETVGDAAILIPPTDTNALAEAMYQVVTSQSLRESLRAKGLARAKNFSWVKTLSLTTATLHKYE